MQPRRRASGCSGFRRDVLHWAFPRRETAALWNVECPRYEGMPLEITGDTKWMASHHLGRSCELNWRAAPGQGHAFEIINIHP
jgi:hypothetical protein